MKKSVVAMIEHDGRILVGKRRDSGRWSFIGGGVDGDETLRQAMSREVLEEVGIAIKPDDFSLVSSNQVGSRDGSEIISVTVFKAEFSSEPEVDVSNDIDQEFTEAVFLSKSYIADGGLEMHIEPKKNLVIQELISNDGAVDTDAVQVALTRKEKRAIQSEISVLFGKIDGATRKDKRKIQSEIISLFDRLDVDINAGDEVGGSDVISLATAELKKISNKQYSELDAESLSFFDDEVLKSIEQMVESGYSRAVAFSRALSEYQADISAFANGGIELDGAVEQARFKELLSTALNPETPSGASDVDKKQKAFEELTKLVKRNKGLLSVIEE